MRVVPGQQPGGYAGLLLLLAAGSLECHGSDKMKIKDFVSATRSSAALG